MGFPTPTWSSHSPPNPPQQKMDLSSQLGCPQFQQPTWLHMNRRHVGVGPGLDNPKELSFHTRNFLMLDGEVEGRAFGSSREERKFTTSL